MKKTNTSVTKITVLFIFLLVLVVGYYAYLSGTHRTEQQEAVMSEVDTALSRDLDNDYPATPKEVIKYYNDLMKCFYNEECTAEELQDLGRKSLQLFDEELQENNDEDTYLIRLQGEVQNYKDNKRKITSVSLAPSTNVDYYSVDGYSFARISCSFCSTCLSASSPFLATSSNSRFSSDIECSRRSILSHKNRHDCVFWFIVNVIDDFF